MAAVKKELIGMLNKALELEHAARIQYLCHAELIKGLNAEKIIDRLTEIASDEEKHEKKFRNLIGNYLDGEPSMGMAPTHRASEVPEILKINRKGEKEAIDFYKEIYQKVVDAKKDLPYEFETLEHEIRHVILDEEEHVAELTVLLGD
ncbi:MAG: ferritin-like domain-containing protein [Candidatus Omnitrophica bacterium]|nr:ferritin-like domain-containing protein [Candidatus Omnitrophota bacterium]